MAIEIVMPQLGLTMTEGTIIKWLKKVGEPVNKGDALFEVETDKVVQEVGSLDEGILGEIVVGEGGVAPVGSPIAYLRAEGETLQPQGNGHNGRTEDPGLRTESSEVKPLTPQPSALSPVGSAEGVRISPAARKLAEKLGVDYRSLKGSGPAGRIVEADIRHAAETQAAPAAVAAAPAVAVSPTPIPQPPTPAAAGERIELRGVRKVVAERMALSFSTAPHFYLTVEVDASALVAFHKQLVPAVQKRYGVEPTLTDLMIKATAMALREHPDANSSWANGAIQRNTSVNLGVAAALKDGLVVPVVPGADRLSLGEIARKRRELVEKARGGQLALTDLEGGTFTLSNLGMFGIDQFQAIVNPPQAAILAVGRIKDRVTAVDGQAVVRPSTFVTLSVDHRVMDGAAAAQFLSRVVELLETPMEMVISE